MRIRKLMSLLFMIPSIALGVSLAVALHRWAGVESPWTLFLAAQLLTMNAMWLTTPWWTVDLGNDRADR